MTDKEIMDGVLAEFANMAAIPRPSNCERQISNFLKERALSLVAMSFKMKSII